MRDKTTILKMGDEEFNDPSQTFFFRDKQGRPECVAEAYLTEDYTWVITLSFVGVHRHKKTPSTMLWRPLPLPPKPQSGILALVVAEEVKRIRRSIARRRRRKNSPGRLVQKASC